MRRLCLLLLVLLSLPAAAPGRLAGSSAQPAAFGVAAHNAVNIEWWYVNAHVTTERGRRLALIGSFFRFGDGRSPLDGTPLPRAHYLIYAVTDLDRKRQRSYSLADANMVALLKQFGPLLAVSNPHDRGVRRLLTALDRGRLPAPHRQFSGIASLSATPFRIAYGSRNTLAANAAGSEFVLNLDGGGPDRVRLTLQAQKPPMAVGGRGETGLKTATDMYYFSLTRCGVEGTIDTGQGPERIRQGQGWFDHQWGNSWVVQNDGWDWWGVQLDSGEDILFFRQRNLTTGRNFFPLATFMDKSGRQTVSRNIVFCPDPRSLWKSPQTGVRYPLRWSVRFPERHLDLEITAAVPDQEMPILGPGGGIWEGTCRVVARSSHAGRSAPVGGVAYMELVGYNSPAVRAQLARHH